MAPERAGHKRNRKRRTRKVFEASRQTSSGIFPDSVTWSANDSKHDLPNSLSYSSLEGLSIVIPVLNESVTNLGNLKLRLESDGAQVIIVDDGSRRPFQDAIKHGENYGYGAAILTGLKQAKHDIVLTMDGDSQHRPDDVLNLWKVWKILEGSSGIDMLIGARKLKSEIWYRYCGRKALNWFASCLLTYWLPDLNSGFRMFRKDIVEGYSSILCKTYSFTTSLTVSMVADHYKVEWFPIKVMARKTGSSKVKLFRHGLITLYYIVRNGLALRTRKLRAWLRMFRWWMWLTRKPYLQSTSKTGTTLSFQKKSGQDTKTASKNQLTIS